jgi:hypothetical protein
VFSAYELRDGTRILDHRRSESLRDHHAVARGVLTVPPRKKRSGRLKTGLSQATPNLASRRTLSRKRRTRPRMMAAAADIDGVGTRSLRHAANLIPAGVSMCDPIEDVSTNAETPWRPLLLETIGTRPLLPGQSAKELRPRASFPRRVQHLKSTAVTFTLVSHQVWGLSPGAGWRS